MATAAAQSRELMPRGIGRAGAGGKKRTGVLRTTPGPSIRKELRGEV